MLVVIGVLAATTVILTTQQLNLNDTTVDDRYSLPRIQDFNSKLAGPKNFSEIDLVRGCHQIPMAADSVHKTAIVTPFELWEFFRMLFVIKNAGEFGISACGIHYK